MIRTVHHLSATGGTLISRYIASLPGTVLLSEVNPRSELIFLPTDPLYLLCRALGRMDDYRDEQVRRYRETARIAEEAGRTLVLRDHSHNDFLRRAVHPRSLLDVLERAIGGPVRSLVTVRNPIDSWLSMLASDGFARNVTTFALYCERYGAFLDAYEGTPVLRYEDFVADPSAAGHVICDALDLPFSDDLDAMNAIRLSGNSGRGGQLTAPRPLPRRAMSEAVRAGIAEAMAAPALFARMGYAFDP